MVLLPMEAEPFLSIDFLPVFLYTNSVLDNAIFYNVKKEVYICFQSLKNAD